MAARLNQTLNQWQRLGVRQRELFYPESLPNLAGQWKAETGITIAGSGISNWANQAVTGSGYDWVQGTDAQRPQLISNVINGYPVIRGDGVNDNLQLTGTGLNLLRNIGGVTLYIVRAMPSAQTTTHAMFSATKGDSSAASRLIVTNVPTLKVTATGRRLDADSTQGTGSNDYAYETPGSFKIWTIQVDWTNHTLKQWLNGALVASEPNFFAGGNTSDTASQIIRLLTDAAGGNATPGDVAEMLAYQTAHSDTERLKVEGYLSEKYQIARRFLLCDGDSGTAAGGGSPVTIERWQRWPSQLNSNLAKGIGMVNFALAGDSIAGRNSAAASGIDLFTCPPYTTERILWLWCGSNDLSGGATPAQVYANLKTYFTNRWATGKYDSFGYATPMARYNVGSSTDWTPTIQTYADLVRAGWNNGAGELASQYHVKYFCDVAADPRFNEGSDTANTSNYQTDRIHLVVGSGTGPSATGYAAIADLVRNALGM